MAKPLLVLNLDGVCLDPSRGLEISLRRALIRIGHPIPCQQRIHDIASRPLEHTLGRVLGRASPALIEHAMSALMGEYQRSGQYGAEPCAGIHRAMHRINTENLGECFILSHRGQYTANRLLKQARLGNYCHGLLSPVQALAPRDMLALLLAWLDQQSEPRTIVYVTDCPSQAEQAKTAGLNAMLAAWGRSSWRRLRSTGAPWVMAEPSHLPAMLRLAHASLSAPTRPSAYLNQVSQTLPVLNG